MYYEVFQVTGRMCQVVLFLEIYNQIQEQHQYLLYIFKTAKMGTSSGFSKLFFLYLGFSSHDIHDSHEKRGGRQLILAPFYATSTPFLNTLTLAGRSPQKAYLCA